MYRNHPRRRKVHLPFYTLGSQTIKKYFSTVDPPTPTGKKMAVLQNCGKGSHILYNQEKAYSGLEKQRFLLGEEVNGRAVLGG